MDRSRRSKKLPKLYKSSRKKSSRKKSSSKMAEDYIRKRSYNLLSPGTLTVSVYANFFPIAFKGQGKKVFRGLDVDIITLFARVSGLRLVFIEKQHFDGIWN